MTGGLWGIATILGPLLLMAVIIWAVMRNRKANDNTVDRADRGAERLREEIEEDQTQ